MPENPFSEPYTRLSPAALLKILSRAQDYQPLAVETARAELGRRELSPEVLEEAKLELEKEKLLEQEKEENREALLNRVREAGIKLFDILNPAREKASRPARLINIISLVILLSYFYTMIREYGYFHFLIFETSPSFLLILTCAFGFLYTPLTTVLFWQRKKAGWILLAIYLSLSVFLNLVSLRQYWKLQGISADSSLSSALIPKISPSPLLLGLAFHVGMLLLVCKPRIRVFYRVRMKLMLGIILTTMSILCMIASLYGG